MTSRDRSDGEVVYSVLKGNRDDFGILVTRYSDRVYSIGVRFFRNSVDAEDFAQEVFIKTYENLYQYRGTSPFKSWLSAIAYNHGRTLYQKKINDAGPLPENIYSEDLTPEHSQLDKETRYLLNQAIEELPEKYRVCVDLSFYWGLSYREVQDITGFPVNTIKSHVLRARRLLYEKLKGTLAEEYNEM